MFTLGFKKIAGDGHNNQGLEFKNMDTEPTPNEGPGGMSPSGIESYQPIPSNNAFNKQPARQQKKMSPLLAAIFLTKRADNLMNQGMGTEGDAASTIATQLKWDSTTDSPRSSVDKAKEAIERQKKYKKADRK